MDQEDENDKILNDIQEETEEEIQQEAFEFQNSSSSFNNIACKINLIILKIKKIINTFNASNNLTRALRNEQKENPLNLLSDLENKQKKTKCVLQLIQDVITR